MNNVLQHERHTLKCFKNNFGKQNFEKTVLLSVLENKILYVYIFARGANI